MKYSKFIMVGLAVVIFGVATGTNSTISNSDVVSAKARTVKVLRSSGMSKTAYNANGGSIFTTAKLTKKAHNASSYLRTTFYATKSATVRKSNGNTAVYYYIKSSNGRVKGWIWKGNLSKKPSYTKQKADIKAMLQIVRTTTSDAQNELLADFDGITPAQAYDSLSTVINDMKYIPDGSGNIECVGAAYQLFAGRFNSTTNAKLSALYGAYTQAEQSGDRDNWSDAANNLADQLAEAVENL
ncbi:hypothetical protein KTE19_05435 [Lentilactobacillus sp. IMAU92037]|uniref:hypothetical protein n=1 Tax=Lentilactobacillus dabitei TaxID=2831523 RepID=UPI001C2C2240|nr:hypothetical protein [Lentilactobacillus dabitei]MBV0930157.1 hypothetical protein [Lentilactobacillus dabitei]